MDVSLLSAIIVPLLFASIALYVLYFVIRSGVRDGILQADRKRAEAKDEHIAGV